MPYRTVWADDESSAVVRIIDQRWLPWKFELADLTSVEQVATAIREMWVRGAGCIGATAGFGMWLAALEASRDIDFSASLHEKASRLLATRPTAVNLAYAVQRQLQAIDRVASFSSAQAVKVAWQTAQAIADEDASACHKIGQHGLELIREISIRKQGQAINILTHCNAGWLAFVDYGSATSPIYAAHQAGIPVHVWVDETRPRNQGARLTAWELGREGIPHTVICDNTGGHLMQHGMVDLVITGADRVTRTGDVANKIGTYLKALAAWDNQVPFYVALPTSTIDWDMEHGIKNIPIEQRGNEEVRMVVGRNMNHKNEILEVEIIDASSPIANYAFDVTPARLITGLITEKGISKADEHEIRRIHHPSTLK